MSAALEQITLARVALEKARSIPEVKKIRDQAEAIIAYARQQRCSRVAQNHAAELKLRAERKLGVLIPQVFPNHRPAKKALQHGTLSDAGISRCQSHRYQLEATVTEDRFAALVAEALDETGDLDLTSAALLAIAKADGRAQRQARIASQAAIEPSPGFVTDLAALAGQTFGTIYADPPWAYSNQVTRAATGNHYRTMTVEELCALPVRELAADRSHLHLWTTNAFLFECPKIFAAWGFQFKSSFIWVKTSIGIGNYWRNSHEFLLLAIRGGLRAADRSLRSWFECDRGKHSEKPDAVREFVERMTPGPRLEMFGRRAVEGWTVFGNERTEML